MFSPPAADTPQGEKMTLLIEMLKESTRLWRVELGEVPDESVTWQPFRRSHSIGGLLLHMADTESHWIQTVILGVPRTDEEMELLMSREINPEAGIWPVPPQWPLSRYYQLQDRIRDRTLGVLRSIQDPEASVQGDKTVQQVVSYLISHEAYHAGQMMLHKIHHSWNGVEPTL